MSGVDPTWKRIGAFHAEDDGTVGAVWMAHDEMSSVVHIYDVARFARDEVVVVMSDAIAARGRHYPLSWAKKDKGLADKFLDAGINTLAEPCQDDPAMIEVVSRQIRQMLRSGRLRVDKRLGEWLREYNDYHLDGSSVPTKGFPLMSATRHAIEMINYAQRESLGKLSRRSYPQLAIV